MEAAATASSSSDALIGGGRYRLQRLLGRGGMGSVYAAVELSSGKVLALKLLSRSDDASALSLFEREYQTLAGLRHPSIVEVYDYGRDPLGPFYTMELIDGADLRRAAPMPWREVCRLMRDTASALGLLHARHLVHRDLSPRNLLRTASGRPKLIDFGVLAPYGPSVAVVGTPPFVAPEALRGLPLDRFPPGA
jgi:serine/threonine protein kinase